MAENEVKEEDKYQLKLRKDGKIPIISVEADCLAEATHKAIIACHDYGARIETPKQKPGMTLGYDADVIVKVNNPDSEPKIYSPGMYDTAEGVMQYILEVTHGIHNHWKKSPEHPERWGYTYNERFVDQLAFIFTRIKADWNEKAGQWPDGKGRPSGRDYQFTTWRAGEDIILEQDDPPCLQRGQLRLLLDEEGELVLNYLTDWRSRDLLKAWNENNIAQIELMKLFRDKISYMLGREVRLGAYIDRSSSLHLYGLYVDRDNLERQIENMKETEHEFLTKFEKLAELVREYKNYSKKEASSKLNGISLGIEKEIKQLRGAWKKRSMSLDEYFMMAAGKDMTGLKRFIAAQMDAEAKDHGFNRPRNILEDELGYDVDTFDYPEEWDTWPSTWDREDRSKLPTVL